MKWLWLLLLVPISVSAGTLDTFIQLQQVPNNVYYYKVYQDNRVSNFPATFKIAAGRYIYCLEPGIGAGSGMYSSQNFYMPLNYNFTSEQIKTMQLYATFGYGYANHQTTNYYLATQELIWMTTGLLKNFRWQYGTNNSNIHSVDTEKNNIINLSNQYQKEPSMNKIISGKIGDAITLIDSNNALNNYQVVSNNATISSNRLTFYIKDHDVINLVKGNNLVKDSTFYYRNSDQLMANLNINEVSQIDINVDGYYEANINVTIKDTDNNYINSEIGLYQDDTLIDSKKAVDGIVGFNNIAEGVYDIKQVTVDDQYYLDENKYQVIINSNNNQNIIITNQFKTSQLNISEFSEVFDLSNNSYSYQPSNFGIYQIWQDNHLIQEIKADEQSLPMRMGIYQIKQVKTDDKLKLNSNVFEVDLNKDNHLVITNDLLKTQLNINSIDAFNNQHLNTSYAIYQDNDKLDISNNILLPYGKYELIPKPINGFYKPDIRLVNLDHPNQKINIIYEPIIKLPQTDNYNYIMLFIILGLGSYVFIKIIY